MSLCAPDFLNEVWGKLFLLIGSSKLPEQQIALLDATISRFRSKLSQNPLADPLAFFFLIVQAEKQHLDECAQWLGVSCIFYLISIDTIDDVQDDDLAGKIHEEAGAAIAINSGMCLFVLALAALQRAIREDKRFEKHASYLEAFYSVGLAAASGQYIDLVNAANSLPEVIEAHKSKTSSIVLIVEFASIFSDVNICARELYREAAQNMAVLVQILGDVKDIFGKDHSPDLRAKKTTLPIAAYYELTQPLDRDHIFRITLQEIDGIKAARQLLYSSGAIKRCAEIIEECRKDIHRAIAQLNNSSHELRNWLILVDGLAAQIYVPPQIKESYNIFNPAGGWHDEARFLADNFMQNMREFNPPELPTIVPFGQPQWLYDFSRKTLFYPDFDAQSDAIIPAMAALVGIENHTQVLELATRQGAAVMAHELFHYWRDAAGRLTNDYWYEELAANRLAASYVRKFHPDLLSSTKEIANRALSIHGDLWNQQCENILKSLLDPDRKPMDVKKGYGVGLQEMALIQLAMVRNLLSESVDLETLVDELL